MQVFDTRSSFFRHQTLLQSLRCPRARSFKVLHFMVALIDANITVLNFP